MVVKFLSLNIFEGGLLFDNILDFLHQEKPDVLALQEVNNGLDKSLSDNLRSIDVLKSVLPNFDYFFAPEILVRYPEGKIDIGNAIFSRYPISNKKTIFLSVPYGEYDLQPKDGDYSKHPKNMQCCDVSIADSQLRVCNLHGIWGLDGADNELRLEMGRRIVNEIKDTQKVILAGDFNLLPNTDVILDIEKHLTNVFKDELHTSFNLSRKDLVKHPGYASAVVDMVFVSPDLRVVDHRCPQVDVSDHLPLIVEIDV